MNKNTWDAMQQTLNGLGLIGTCIICRQDIIVDRHNPQRWTVCLQDQHFVTRKCSADNVDLGWDGDKWIAICSACNYEFTVEDEQEFYHIRDHHRTGWKKFRWIIRNISAIRIKDVIMGVETLSMQDVLETKKEEAMRIQSHHKYHTDKLNKYNITLDKLEQEKIIDLNAMWSIVQKMKYHYEQLQSKPLIKYPLWRIEFSTLNLDLGYPNYKIGISGHVQILHWDISLLRFRLIMSYHRNKSCEIEPCKTCGAGLKT